jgi:hypothetical protein
MEAWFGNSGHAVKYLFFESEKAEIRQSFRPSYTDFAPTEHVGRELCLLTPLFPEVKLFDHGLVTVLLGAFQVIQQASPSSDQFQQPATGRMIFTMAFQVISQLIDPTSQKRDLDVGTTGVLIV